MRSDISQEIKQARNWYWWLWLSPAVTIPTFLLSFSRWDRDLSRLVCPSRPCPGLIENAIPAILLILISSLWHLVLLIPARSKGSVFVRWHGFQMLFLAGIQTLVPILAVLMAGKAVGTIYSIPFFMGAWLFGNVWGHSQAAKGESSFLVWFGKESWPSGQTAALDAAPSGLNDLHSLTEIIRFSPNQPERQTATNALIRLGLVEYFDGTPVTSEKDFVPAESGTKSGIWIFGVIVGITLLCLLASLSNAIHKARNESKNLVVQQVRQTATAAAAPASIQSIRTELERAKHWPVVISDSFDSNDMGWTMGQPENDSLVSDCVIQDGVYRIKTKSTQDFFLWDTPKMQPVSDFYLAVDAHEKPGNSESTFGLIFRVKDEDFYTFRTNGSSIEVALLHSDHWQSLKGNQRWGMVKREGDFFKLAVLAREQYFYFFINDELVGKITNFLLTNGRVGIIIENAGSASKKTFEFDNFELRAP